MTRFIRYGLAVLGLMLCVSGLYAQQNVVTVVQDQAVINSLRLEHLWKVTLINQTQSPLEVYLMGKITQDSRALYQGRSKQMVLQPGMNRFNASDFEGVQNLFQSPLLSVSEPIAPQYSLCLNVYSLEDELLGSSCREISIIPPTPPYLIYPFNEDELREPVPVLTWSPPAPVTAKQVLRYEIKIVELQQAMPAAAAIQALPAYFTKRDLYKNVMPYPAAARKLNPEKEYAWQIEAFDQHQSLGKSEVWVFSFAKDTEPEVEEEHLPYVALQRNLDGGFYPALEQVRFKFDQDYTHNMPNVHIFDNEGDEVGYRDTRFERKGDNRFVIYMPPGTGFKNGHYYTLVATNAKGEHLKLKFKYQYKER